MTLSTDPFHTPHQQRIAWERLLRKKMSQLIYADKPPARLILPDLFKLPARLQTASFGWEKWSTEVKKIFEGEVALLPNGISDGEGRPDGEFEALNQTTISTIGEEKQLSSSSPENHEYQENDLQKMGKANSISRSSTQEGQFIIHSDLPLESQDSSESRVPPSELLDSKNHSTESPLKNSSLLLKSQYLAKAQELLHALFEHPGSLHPQKWWDEERRHYFWSQTRGHDFHPIDLIHQGLKKHGSSEIASEFLKLLVSLLSEHKQDNLSIWNASMACFISLHSGKSPQDTLPKRLLATESRKNLIDTFLSDSAFLEHLLLPKIGAKLDVEARKFKRFSPNSLQTVIGNLAKASIKDPDFFFKCAVKVVRFMKLKDQWTSDSSYAFHSGTIQERTLAQHILNGLYEAHNNGDISTELRSSSAQIVPRWIQFIHNTRLKLTPEEKQMWQDPSFYSYREVIAQHLPALDSLEESRLLQLSLQSDAAKYKKKTERKSSHQSTVETAQKPNITRRL